MNTSILSYSQVNNLLYKDNDKGFINVFRKGFKGVYNRSYRKEMLDDGLKGYFDGEYTTELYCTLNTFIIPNRTIESLRYLNALYIDIDCYKMNLRKESVLFFLENDLYNSVIPEPSLVVDSGRGLYLIWLIERVPSKAIRLWNAMQYYLYNALKEFGADRAALDAARVLRVVGSHNLKSDSQVKVLEYNPIRYKLKELKEEYLPDISKQQTQVKEKKEFKGKIVRFYFNIYSLYKARMNDLLKLAELREYSFPQRREIFLFIFRYYATLVEGEDEAERLAFELNEKFEDPLPLNELRSTYSNYSGKYNYKNETLVELFEVSDEEMKHMNSLVSKEFKYEKNNAKRREKRRNAEGLTTREAAKKEKMLSIVKGMMNDKSTKEISEEYNISIRIVQKYKKELIEKEEIFNSLKEEIINATKKIENEKSSDNSNQNDFEFELDFKEIEELFGEKKLVDVGS